VGSRVGEASPAVDYIAESLSLSTHTIARHLSNACAKLGAANRTEAPVKFEEMKV
jgi:DNA-binding NarL/FixJ family response regulator